MTLSIRAQRSRGCYQNIMENRAVRIFRIDFMLNLVVLLISTRVISMPVNKTTTTVVDVMKNDTSLCNKTAEYFYKLDYIQRCSLLKYPTIPYTENEITNAYLCLIFYDTAYKICTYSEDNHFSFNSTEMINLRIKDFTLKENNTFNITQQDEYCEKYIQGFKPMYTKIKYLWKPLIDDIDKYRCRRICFDLKKHFNPLCAIFAWIKSVDDSINKNTTVANQTSISDVKLHHHTNDKESTVKKKIEQKENVSTPVLSAEHTQPDTENAQLNTKKVNKIDSQKKSNNSSLEMQIPTSREEDKGDVAITKSETNVETSKVPDNIPKVKISNSKEADEKGNVEEPDKPDKKQNDIKTSTISENTQEHYDVANAEEDTDSNVGNTEELYDEIQQPIHTAGNQNEKLQGAYEQKNNVRYPDTRTDDSHFFTYLTVITVACIAGYIGYHNKQKIFAIVLEGRRSRNNRGRRRPSTASYRKLDCTLEEAVTSQCNANVTHVIY